MISGKINLDLKAMESLKLGVKNKVTRQAITAAIKPLVKQVKAVMPVDTGALRTSISSKVRTYRERQVTVGIVGARTDYTKKGRRPVRYLNIIEARTRIIKSLWAREGGAVQARITEEIRKRMAAL